MKIASPTVACVDGSASPLGARVGLIVLVAALAFVGCVQPDLDPPGKSCQEHSDCPSDMICIQLVCLFGEVADAAYDQGPAADRAPGDSHVRDDLGAADARTDAVAVDVVTDAGTNDRPASDQPASDRTGFTDTSLADQETAADSQNLPDTPQSDTAQPDTAQPDTAQLDTAQLDTAQPDTAQPDTARPDTTTPADRSQAPPILILEPAGGEIWAAGSVQHIRWETVEIDDVTLLFTADNGQSYSYIEPTVATSSDSWGDYAWTVPGISSNSCRIRIEGYSGEHPTSSGIFTID